METQQRRAFSDYVPPMTGVTVGAIIPPSRLQSALLVVKTLSILGVAVAAIFTAGIFWSSYRDLPKRTEQNQQNIASLTTGLESVRSEVAQVKNLLTESLCLQKAEKLNTDWRDCLVATGQISVIGPRAP